MGQSQAINRTVVLVVEDEPVIRMMASEFVEEAGFSAIEAADGNEALKILESRDDIGIMFTDVRMPGGLNGIDLARQVRVRWPSVRILVTSGHMAAHDPELAPSNYFVPKPYNLNQLSDLLERLSH